jgi:uncharacterized membrane protein
VCDCGRITFIFCFSGKSASMTLFFFFFFFFFAFLPDGRLLATDLHHPDRSQCLR